MNKELIEISNDAIKKASVNGMLIGLMDDLNNQIVQYHSIIFTHKFAKAFWGEEKISFTESPFPLYLNEYEDNLPAWQFHLQQMVLEENPLSYLEKWL